MAPPPPLDAAAELAAADAALRALGYAYNAADELRSLDGDAPFKFEGQPLYEKLATAVAAYVQARLLAQHGLRRCMLGKVDCYASPDFETASGLLVLLCGAGQVAAGQWARRLCINESLRTGSVMPYVEWAKDQGLGVLIMNPNHKEVAGHSEAHVVAAWDACVAPAAAAHVVMVAHSYGGVCTCALLRSRRGATAARLRAVALTDSVHGRGGERLPRAQRAFFAAQVCNWVTSDQPRDTPVRGALNTPPPGHVEERAAGGGAAAGGAVSDGGSLSGDDMDSDSDSDAAAAPPARPYWAPPWCDAARVSAGAKEHEATSEACRPSACAFLLRELRASGWAPPADA